MVASEQGAVVGVPNFPDKSEDLQQMSTPFDKSSQPANIGGIQRTSVVRFAEPLEQSPPKASSNCSSQMDGIELQLDRKGSNLSRRSSISLTLSERYGIENFDDLRKVQTAGTTDTPAGQAVNIIGREELNKLKAVGQGAFAEVHLAEYSGGGANMLPPRSPSPGLPVAVKQLKKNSAMLSELDVIDFVDEARLMMQLQHKNIISTIGVGTNKPANEQDPDVEWKNMYLVQEYASGGALRSKIMDQMINYKKTVYTFSDALRWSLNIARAIQFMHNHNPTIIHRDIKCDNILLCVEEETGQLVAKVADLGLHTVVYKNNNKADVDSSHQNGNDSGDVSYALTGNVGAFSYMAPEVLQGKPYNEKVDCFSLSIVIYELFTKSLISARYLNAAERDDSEQHACKVAAGWRPPFPSFMPEELKRLIDRGWSTSPELRPNMNEIVRELEAINDSGLVANMDAELTKASKRKAKCVIM